MDTQYDLGVVYEQGRGVAKDEITAGKWFPQAAQHGKKEAEYKMAELYEQGRGVPQNYAEAFGIRQRQGMTIPKLNSSWDTCMS